MRGRRWRQGRPLVQCLARSLLSSSSFQFVHFLVCRFVSRLWRHCGDLGPIDIVTQGPRRKPGASSYRLTHVSVTQRYCPTLLKPPDVPTTSVYVELRMWMTESPWVEAAVVRVGPAMNTPSVSNTLFATRWLVLGRGLHLSTFWLDLSTEGFHSSTCWLDLSTKGFHSSTCWLD
jgi:hypothetical protein